jgi:hypothetical protein
MRRGEQHTRVIEAAKKAGVKHVRSIYSVLESISVADKPTIFPDLVYISGLWWV